MTIKTTIWDTAERLDSPAAIAGYFDAAPKIIALALGNIARESLYRALGENGNPTLETLLKVLKSVGVNLTAQP